MLEVSEAQIFFWGGGLVGGGTAGIQTLKYSVAMKVCPAVTFFE